MIRERLLTAAIVLAAALPAPASAASGSAKMSYKIMPTVSAQVVPNYQSGFGPQGGSGSGVTPAAGAGATLGGGTVDFGNVMVGYQYIYKYAAQVKVQTNDNAGFVVYGEGATDLNATSSTYPIFQTLYWLPSASGNNAYSAATTFNNTTGTAISGGAGGIDYTSVGGTPSGGSVVWTYPGSGNVNQGYDFQLRLANAIPTSQFNVYIVYTVIGN